MSSSDSSSLFACEKPGKNEVFISYSRQDKSFVERLCQAFQKHDREVWVDWEDIPVYADWRQEIHTGILEADAFLLVISPASVASVECRKEIELAIQHQKRLLPIVHRDIDRALHQQIPPEVGAINWFFFRETDDFAQSFQALLKAIDTDLQHVQTHTWLLIRTNEWQVHNQDESFLLRGKALETIEQWIVLAVGKNPQPTQAQREFVSASRLQETARQKREARRQRLVLMGITIAFAVTSILAWIAESRRRQAVLREIEAVAASSDTRFASEQTFPALLQALRAGVTLKQLTWSTPDQDLRSKVMTALSQALFWVTERNRLEGHRGWLNRVSFAPDGQILVSAGLDGIRLWRRDGSLIRTLAAQSSRVMGIEFSPNGQFFASGGFDAKITLWNREGQLIRTWNAPDAVRDVTFSPDGKVVAAATHDGIVSIWRLDGTLVTQLKGHQAQVNRVQFSPDGQLIATASADNTVKLWHHRGKLLTTLKQHQDQVMGLSFSPDGQRLASGSLDKTIRIWRRDGSLMTTIAGLSDGVQVVRFSPDGQFLASAGDDYPVHLWRPNGTLVATLPGHRNIVKDLRFGSDGQILASASNDSSIRFWQVKNPMLTVIPNYFKRPNETSSFNDIPNSVSFSPDNQLLAVGNMDGTVKLWRPDGTLAKTLDRHRERVNSVIFSPDGQHLASVSDDETVILWHRNGKLMRSIKTENPLLDVSFSPDGTMIAIAASGGKSYLFRSDGTAIKTLKKHTKDVWSVRFSPDSKWIVSASDDGTIKLGSLDGTIDKTLKDPDGTGFPLTKVQFSPDGQIIAAASNDGTVKIWRSDGMWIRKFSSESGSISALKFHPNGQMLAAADDQGTIFLWSLEGLLLTKLNGHRKGVWSLDFSSDGKTLASASDDATIILWSVDHLNLNQLLTLGCDWVKNYLETNPNIADGDRRLCKSISP
ncbi:RHS Repeat family protein [Leptolyngbya sp. NIES-3755]|nr:RHS Repeat family protein [Leptolyngbya sp. NIES-3755]